jgi:hypothetical protein
VLRRRGEVDVGSPPPSPEPLAPELLGHPRSVFTPHLGSAVAEVRRDIEMRAAESILQALDGEPPGGRDQLCLDRDSVTVGRRAIKRDYLCGSQLFRMSTAT